MSMNIAGFPVQGRQRQELVFTSIQIGNYAETQRAVDYDYDEPVAVKACEKLDSRGVH